MIYTDKIRLALYKEGVDLTRPGMTIRGREIMAYLREAKSESSLDRREADGSHHRPDGQGPHPHRHGEHARLL